MGMTQRSQLPLSLELPKGEVNAALFVTAANETAMAYLAQWQDWPAPYHSFNIYGPAGCGKSQMGAFFANRTKAMIIDSLPLFNRSRFDEYDVIVLDGVSAEGDWSGDALFHFCNYLSETGKYALFLSETPISQLGFSLADVRSRLRAIPSQEIQLPDDELLRALFESYFHERQCAVTEAVLDYIVARCDRSYEAVAQLVSAIDRESLAAKQAITIPLVRAVFEQKDRMSE